MANEVMEAFKRCLQRYPTIQLSFEIFQSRVEEIITRDMSLADEGSQRKTFLQIHHEDLFLAIACSNGDRIAWEYFADDFFPVLKNYAAQACGSSSEGEDLAQEITTKLLKEKNRLAGYNGRGSLAGWLRVTVSHAAIDRYRRRRREIPLEDLQQNSGLASLADSERNITEESLDSHWGPVISEVVNETISDLSARDRLILGLYYLRDVPLKTIGRQLRIHEATVSRWLNRLRREIRKRVEHKLRKKHGLRPSEIQALWKSISISSAANPIAENIYASTGPDAETTKGCVCEQKNPARRID